MIPPGVLVDIRLIIFDLDGTLLDTEEDLARSVNAVREQMGLGLLPHRQVASYVGQGVHVLIQRALGESATKEDLDRAVRLFLEAYHDHMFDHTVPYAGVREALQELTGHTLAVLTNKPVGFSRDLLAGLGLADFFRFVYGGNSFDKKKPDPVGVVKLLHDTETPPQATLVVGDSETDVQTARNAGVWACGVTYGIGSASLEATPPDFLVTDLRELPRILKGEK